MPHPALFIANPIHLYSWLSQEYKCMAMITLCNANGQDDLINCDLIQYGTRLRIACVGILIVYINLVSYPLYSTCSGGEEM